jgi:hypothetical protein
VIRLTPSPPSARAPAENFFFYRHFIGLCRLWGSALSAPARIFFLRVFPGFAAPRIQNKH